MRNLSAKIIDSNLFFVSLVFFAAFLPFSQAFVSIGSGIVLFTALTEKNPLHFFQRIRKNKFLILLPLIFVIYTLSAVISGKISDSLYDLRKNLFYLVIPLAFVFGKEISSGQKRYLFFFFSFAVFVSTIVALLNWMFHIPESNFSVHQASLISHIRFSFQLVLVFWFYILIVYRNYRYLRLSNSAFFLITALYFILFLLFQQSLTGILALITSTVYFIFYFISRKKGKLRKILLLTAFVIITIPIVYILYVVVRFYCFEKVNPSEIETITKAGHPYQHDFGNKMVENGRYVYLYICEEEMREEWNRRSEIKYDSIDINGYPVSSTLIRYLTSKGLRKDAEGVKALDEQDIQNVQRGIANFIFHEKKISLYPRIYQTVWEFYVYSRTGYANHQSFSQRIEYVKAALSIIKEHFWIGVGTGGWKEAFKAAYKKNNSSLSEDLYASSHNQYLNYMVKFGMIGFFLIMFILVFPVIKTKSYRDLLFMLFLVFMFFVNFADSNLESHMGSSFFLLFYCLFITSGGKEFLGFSS